LVLAVPMSRTVMNDDECVCAIAQGGSAVSLNDTEAPMLDDDITAWSEFKLMRRMIELTGAHSCTAAGCFTAL
jgi:hypothetical protein